MAKTMPSIPEWFHGKSVFVTGATGFMGKVLIHKLLSSCPGLGNVYILIREKKGVGPQARLQDLMQEQPFRILKEKHPDSLSKIIPITGDTMNEGLGVSDADKQRLLRDISVVFHMAANVRFNLSLKSAVKTNTQGTLNVLAFVKQMAHLQSFIHVSTTYCQCAEAVLEERAYPTAIDPENVIMTVNNMSDEVLDAMTSKILGDHPNTYAFSKSLSEDLVQKCGLPAGVARPSIITASWKEPLPGWVDNMNGPTGLMIGGGKGVIRSVHCNPNYSTNIIPCDIVINALIALAWKVGLENPAKPIFMNVTETGDNPISWGDAVERGRKHAVEHPFSGPLWYPGGSVTSSKLRHSLCVVLFHYLPAYFIDMLLPLTGNKPFLVRVQNRVSCGLEMVQYYTTKEWVFLPDRMKELQTQMLPGDRETFFMDMSSLSWDSYILQYILGARQYCLKDDLSTLPQARKVMSYLYIADTVVKIALTVFIGCMIYFWLTTYRETTGTILEANEI